MNFFYMIIFAILIHSFAFQRVISASRRVFEAPKTLRFMHELLFVT